MKITLNVNHIWQIERILSICGFILIFSTVLWSQKEKYNPSLCVYVGNSDAVFVGTLTATTKDAVKNRDPSTADFAVIRPLKGTLQTSDQVSAVANGHSKNLSLGGPYLVFLRINPRDQKYVIGASFPVIFIDGSDARSTSKDDYQIAFGDFHAGNKDDLSHFKVTISSNGKTYKPKFFAGGAFVTVFDRSLMVYGAIETSRPLYVSILGSPFAQITDEPNRTIVKYELNEPQGSCQYREFTFYARRE